MSRLLLAGALLVPAACGDAGQATAPPLATSLAAVNDAQAGAVGGMLAGAVGVVVRDQAGRRLAGQPVAFAVSAGGGWVVPETATTDAQGRALTTWYLGPRPGSPNRLRATAGGSLALELNATSLPLTDDSTYRGYREFIELIPGELPLIITAPHGGALAPADIPDRTAGTLVRDTNTEELARQIRVAFIEALGRAPSIVITRIHRKKLDTNRDVAEGAGGNATGERLWREWHGFIAAVHDRLEQSGGGFYIDLHGHGHDTARLELGYLLSRTELAQPDATLNGPALVARSSVRHLAGRHAHAALLRGPSSLGSLFETRGFPAVPSGAHPFPGGADYFTGGYNTERYSSVNGGTVDGVQIEANFAGVRDTEASRRQFAEALVEVMREYWRVWYGWE